MIDVMHELPRKRTAGVKEPREMQKREATIRPPLLIVTTSGTLRYHSADIVSHRIEMVTDETIRLCLLATDHRW